MTEPINVEGLTALAKSLKRISTEAPKALRVANNHAAEIVVAQARTTVPVLRGKARASLKARSTRTAARAQGGSGRVPYYGWLEFGGRVGRRKATRREQIKGGRYLWPAFAARRQKVLEELAKQLVDLCERSGLDVR
ncbi:hypothetical protein ALI144C_44820 [Actinosynnema sp. ALI-1.44]|nr:hypothetical protein ALI144C_44820 [Actinosynnema sp. ALI-1.44]